MSATEQPALFPTLPPKPRAVHRPHTAERFWPQRPESEALAVELLKEGRSDNAVGMIVGLFELLKAEPESLPEQRRVIQTNALALIESGVEDWEDIARQTGWASVDTGMRKMVAGLRYLRKIDTCDAARFRAAGLRDAALERADALIPQAKADHLGALSMVATQAHQIERSLGGEASLVVEHRVTGLTTFAELKAKAAAAIAERSTGEAIDVEVVETKEIQNV